MRKKYVLLKRERETNLISINERDVISANFIGIFGKLLERFYSWCYSQVNLFIHSYYDIFVSMKEGIEGRNEGIDGRNRRKE